MTELPLFHIFKILDKLQRGGSVDTNDIYDTMFGSQGWKFVQDLAHYHKNDILYTGENLINSRLYNLRRHATPYEARGGHYKFGRSRSGKALRGNRQRHFKSRPVYKRYRRKSRFYRSSY